MGAALRLALANARAAEARIAAYAAGNVDLAYLRNIAGKLSEAMSELERELNAPVAAGREPLEGMLLIDIEVDDAAPRLSFTEFKRRAA